jgi:hypothetical protein
MAQTDVITWEQFWQWDIESLEVLPQIAKILGSSPEYICEEIMKFAPDKYKIMFGYFETPISRQLKYSPKENFLRSL